MTPDGRPHEADQRLFGCSRASTQEAIKWVPRGKSMSRELESLVLRTLRDIRADAAELKSEMRSLGAAFASDILTVNAKIEGTRKELSDQIVGVRRGGRISFRG